MGISETQAGAPTAVARRKDEVFVADLSADGEGAIVNLVSSK